MSPIRVSRTGSVGVHFREKFLVSTNRVPYAIVRSARLSARAWSRANASGKCTSAAPAVRPGLVLVPGYEATDQGRRRY